MIRRCRAWFWVLLLLGGCAGFDITANPARVPAGATPPDHRTPGRIALVVPAHVQRTVVVLMSPPPFRLHAGAIVEQSMRAALMDGVADRVVSSQDPPPADAGFDGTLKIDSVRATYQQRTRDSFHYESSVRLSFDASLLDARGRVVWTRTYDDVGRATWTSMEFYAGVKAIEIATHDVAWRLSQQATKVVREWLQAERVKPRDL